MCCFLFVPRTSITATLHYTATWYQTAPVAAKAVGVKCWCFFSLFLFSFFWGMNKNMNNVNLGAGFTFFLFSPLFGGRFPT